MRLLLATNNRNKVREMRELLADVPGVEVLSAADFPEVEEPEETGETFAANARLKAAHYAGATGLLALADDSGLMVDALGGRPGVQSSRYGRDDADRIARLLRELEGAPAGPRTARFMCAMALARPGGIVAVTSGTLEGEIAAPPRGSFGFGYDPVFQVPGRGMRLAEIPPEEKNAISHRGNALREMMPILRAELAKG
jgi:XTP/dITP diphosphohydrolase